MRRNLSRLCVAAFVTVVAIESAATAEPSRPNLVVFLSDDHGQLDSTPYGATDVRTPNMQRLADSGMTFTHAFVASPACAPSRSALLTGLMPARNGAEANHAFKKEGIASLPEVLRQLGYQTAAFGKVAHGKDDVLRHGFDVTDPRHEAAVVRDFLKSRDTSRPLCLFVGTHEPHVPWPDIKGYAQADVTLPPTFIDTPTTREFRTRYYTDVTKADTQLGEVLDMVDEFLDFRTSLVMYTSDHGAQWPFGKWNLYDAGIRVPLLVRWPGVVTPKSQSGAMVQWIDIFPTLITVAGGEVPAQIDGQSFLNILRGTSQEHRNEIYTTHSGDGDVNVYPIRSVRTRDWKLIINLHPEFAHTTHIDKALARDGGRYWISWFEKAQSDPAAALIVKKYHERPAVELYDLRSDPFEQHNLAGDTNQASRVAEMRNSLEDWMQAQGDQQTVFNKPRLLSDPAATKPGPNAGTNMPQGR